MAFVQYLESSYDAMNCLDGATGDDQDCNMHVQEEGEYETVGDRGTLERYSPYCDNPSWRKVPPARIRTYRLTSTSRSGTLFHHDHSRTSLIHTGALIADIRIKTRLHDHRLKRLGSFKTRCLEGTCIRVASRTVQSLEPGNHQIATGKYRHHSLVTYHSSCADFISLPLLRKAQDVSPRSLLHTKGRELELKEHPDVSYVGHYAWGANFDRSGGDAHTLEDIDPDSGWMAAI
ncbi:hypothetical protein WG66_009392 [Moniliophthora roreri]|nr:hypothetical protein WG66_009392 [Moniliophthora roreri]